MIDVEIDVFDYVYPFVTAVLPAKNFKSVYVPNPASFPFATLMEMDNVTSLAHRSGAREEDYAIITYEANAYAKTKAECRAVMNAIDQGMTNLGFMRLSAQFIPNLADPQLFRYVARYQAITNPKKEIYRR